MFILIPLVLILGSLAAIFFIIYKKLPQLKNISLPDGNTGSVSQDLGGSSGNYKKLSVKLFNDFFPEITERIGKIKFKEYKDAWLAELEKFLRRLRVASLKIDRFSDHLIKKIRTVGDTRPKIRAAEETIQHPAKIIQNKPVLENIESLKSEEQKLIIEIAKNPKDYRFYELLGDLYVKMENFGDAKESYEAAKELNPHSEVLVKKHSQAVEKMIK